MIEIKENELDYCKKEVLKKQKLIMFYEALMISEKFENRDAFYFMQENITNGCQCDLSRTLVKQLLDEILEEQLTQSFYVDLDDNSSDNMAWNLYKKDPTSVDVKKVQSMASNLVDTQRKLSYSLKVNNLDLIEVMIKTGNYDSIIKIILSDNLDEINKKDIILRIIEYGKDKITNIFDTIPKEYYSNEETKESFKKQLDEKLSIVREERGYGFLSDKAMDAFIFSANDCYTRNCNYLFVKFLIEHNLININNITLSANYNDDFISPACISHLRNNETLANYLYNLPSYKETKPSVRDYSDERLLSYLVNVRDIMNVIKSVNFAATPKKLNTLEMSILNSQKKGNYCYSYDHLDEIVDIFLRKTKKEYYKEMKVAIVSIKTNTDPKLKEEARKRLVRALQNICDPLSKQAPARSTVRDAVKTMNK